MFGRQKNNSNSSVSSSHPAVDPSRIRTFLSSSDSGKKSTEKSFSVGSFAPLSKKDVPKEAEPSLRRDFLANVEEKVPDRGVPSAHAEPVPQTSPFFVAEGSVSKPSLDSSAVKVSDREVKDVALEFQKIDAEEKEKNKREEAHVDAQKVQGEVSVPKEGMQQRASFQPIAGSRTVSENALSNRLSVTDYSGRDGSGSARAKEIASQRMKETVIRIVFAVGIAILIGLSVWGGYVYWKSRSLSVVSEETPIVVENSPSTNTEGENTASTAAFPYEWKLANSLIVNEESGNTPLAELEKAKTQLGIFSGNGVLEFFFVDAKDNLNTISEKTLLKKMGISFSDQLTSLIQDSKEGRVYLSKNDADVRAVIAVPVTSRDAALAAALSSETTLFKSVSPLYFSEVSTEGVVSKFSDQTYREYAIRYFNADFSKNYSLDYAFRRDTLYLATSKQSLRSVLDFLDGKERPASASIIPSSQKK